MDVVSSHVSIDVLKDKHTYPDGWYEDHPHRISTHSINRLIDTNGTTWIDALSLAILLGVCIPVIHRCLTQ